jgi:hypothetical protein
MNFSSIISSRQQSQQATLTSSGAMTIPTTRARASNCSYCDILDDVIDITNVYTMLGNINNNDSQMMSRSITSDQGPAAHIQQQGKQNIMTSIRMSNIYTKAPNHQDTEG